MGSDGLKGGGGGGGGVWGVTGVFSTWLGLFHCRT